MNHKYWHDLFSLNVEELLLAENVTEREFWERYRPEVAARMDAAYRRIGNAGGTAGNAATSTGKLEADSGDALEITVGAAQA